MRKILHLLAVALTVTVAMTGRQSFGQDQYRHTDAQSVRDFRDGNIAYEKAKVLYGKKDLPGARKELLAALRLAPRHSDAHLLMAKILYSEKDYTQALTEVVAAKDGFEANVAFMEQMQQERMNHLLRLSREKEETIASLNVQLSQTSPEGRFAIENQIAEATRKKADIDRQRERPPDLGREIPAEYFFIHGNILLRTQKYPEAAAQYDEALKRKPDYGDAANNLASLYYSARQYDKALAVVEKAEKNGATVNPELKKAIQNDLAKPK